MFDVCKHMEERDERSLDTGITVSSWDDVVVESELAEQDELR